MAPFVKKHRKEQGKGVAQWSKALSLFRLPLILIAVNRAPPRPVT